MRRLGGRNGRIVLVGVGCAALGAAVTLAVVRAQGDSGGARGRHSSAPIALTGVLRDTRGKPVPDAHVQLTAMDDANAKIGQEIPIVMLAATQTDADGRFTIRQSPSVPIIRKLAAENGGYVNFDVYIDTDAGFMPWGIPRKLRSDRWFDDETPAARVQERITFKKL
jgi:hypothetical protein